MKLHLLMSPFIFLLITGCATKFYEPDKKTAIAELTNVFKVCNATDYRNAKKISSEKFTMKSLTSI